MPGDQNPEEPEYTDILGPDKAVGMVENLAELQLRTAREGGTAYVKDEGRFYIYQDGSWHPHEVD